MSEKKNKKINFFSFINVKKRDYVLVKNMQQVLLEENKSYSYLCFIKGTLVIHFWNRVCLL